MRNVEDLVEFFLDFFSLGFAAFFFACRGQLLLQLLSQLLVFDGFFDVALGVTGEGLS